jgi:biotin carboxyl carrier protein
MTKNFRITVDGRPYTVSVDDIEAPDASSAVAPSAVAPNAVAPPVAAHAAPTPPPKPAPAAPPAAAGPGTIISPIGGMVRSIEVEVGAMVTVGETVAIIEVMKMKTEVKSTIAGKVASISARLNQAVETGEAIMTLAA